MARNSILRDTALGSTLVDWRSKRDMTQGQLADHLGVSRQRVNVWENHGIPGPDRRLVRLAMRQLSSNLDNL